MKLFGEYNITNNFDLSIALECIVKYLNITVYDVIDEEDLQERFYYTLNKALYDSSIESVRGLLVNREHTEDASLLLLASSNPYDDYMDGKQLRS